MEKTVKLLSRDLDVLEVQTAALAQRMEELQKQAREVVVDETHMSGLGKSVGMCEKHYQKATQEAGEIQDQVTGWVESPWRVFLWLERERVWHTDVECFVLCVPWSLCVCVVTHVLVSRVVTSLSLPSYDPTLPYLSFSLHPPYFSLHEAIMDIGGSRMQAQQAHVDDIRSALDTSNSAIAKANVGIKSASRYNWEVQLYTLSSLSSCHSPLESCYFICLQLSQPKQCDVDPVCPHRAIFYPV